MQTAQMAPAPRAAQRPVTGSPLLEQLRTAALARGDSSLTADSLVGWIRRFILFHNRRHPSQLQLQEVTHYLEHVVKTESEPLLALTQARAALMLLYREVLGKDLRELPQPRPPRLLDLLCQVLRVRHYAPETENCCVQWARRSRRRRRRAGRCRAEPAAKNSSMRAVYDCNMN